MSCVKLQSPTPNAFALTHSILFRYNGVSMHVHPHVTTISISTCYYYTHIVERLCIYELHGHAVWHSGYSSLYRYAR